MQKEGNMEEIERKLRRLDLERKRNKHRLEIARGRIAHRSQSWQPDSRLEGVKSLGTGGLALFQGPNTCG